MTDDRCDSGEDAAAPRWATALAVLSLLLILLVVLLVLTGGHGPGVHAP